ERKNKREGGKEYERDNCSIHLPHVPQSCCSAIPESLPPHSHTHAPLSLHTHTQSQHKPPHTHTPRPTTHHPHTSTPQQAHMYIPTHTHSAFRCSFGSYLSYSMYRHR